MNVNLAVDWEGVVKVARENGIRKSAREIGVVHSRLLDVENGRNPNFENGLKILIWWARKTGKSLEQVPTLKKKPATLQAFSFLALQNN